MLKQFKKKRPAGRPSNFSKIKKEQTPNVAVKKEEIKVDSSDSDFSVSDSDSEYEEILISSIKKNKKPDVKPDVKPDDVSGRPTRDVGKPEIKKEELQPLKLERVHSSNPKPKKKILRSKTIEMGNNFVTI